MEIFKPQRAPFELENPDKRMINTNGFTQIIPVENVRSTIDIVQQALGSQVLPVSGLSNLSTSAANCKINNNQKKTGISFLFFFFYIYRYSSIIIINNLYSCSNEKPSPFRVRWNQSKHVISDLLFTKLGYDY